jgi:hypothetical protein
VKRQLKASLTGLAIALFTVGCADSASTSGTSSAASRAEIQEVTEDLYWIHLRLDTARSALDEADLALSGGDEATASFHVAEAQRALQRADDKVLELGQEVQKAFDLDRD